MEMDSSVSNQQNIMSDLNEARLYTVNRNSWRFPTVEKKAMDLSTSNSGILRELVEDETVESHVRNILKAEELVGEAKYNEALILLREMECLAFNSN